MSSSTEQATPSTDTTKESTPTSTSSSSSTTAGSSGGGGRSSSLRSMSFVQGAASLSPFAGELAYKGAGGMDAGSAGARQVAEAGISGPSAPIPGADVDTMHATTGVDVSHGRVHTGPAARQACDTLGVEGFALGNNAAFGAASPARDTAFHEYAHIAQQTGTASPQAQGKDGGPELTPSGDLEQQADDVAAAALSGGRAAITTSGAPTVKFRRRRDEEQAVQTADADTEAIIEETHRAEISEVIRYLSGHTSDSDVDSVCEIFSSWPQQTITDAWHVIDRHSNWLDDFCDNVGEDHFRSWPRELLASFKAWELNARWRKAIDLTSTGFLNGCSEEEAHYAYLLLQSGGQSWLDRFREGYPEQWEELRDNLPRSARAELRQALDQQRERERQEEETQRRGEATESQQALEQEDAGGGTLEQIRRLLDDSGLFESVDEDEARQAVTLLDSLGGGIRSAVNQLDTEGKIETLVDALSYEDKYQAPMVAKFLRVIQCRPPAMALHHIEELLSTGLFDWSVSAEEARVAYYLIKSQPLSTQRRFREHDNGAWLERMERNLGEDVAMARGGEEGDSVLNEGYGTASTEGEADTQRDADEALRNSDDAWARFEGVVEQLRSGDQGQYEQAYATLSQVDTQMRQAMVRRLDGMNLVEGLMDGLGYQYLWADGRRHISLSILQVRDPMRSAGHIQHLMSLGLFDWAVTSEEAYTVYQLIRAMPSRYQTLIQQANPSLWDAMMGELSDSQTEADDTNAYTGGEEGADRVNIMDQLADPAIWDATSEEQQTRLRNVLMMAIAAGHRRLCNELARVNGGFDNHAELMAELNLSEVYEPGELEGTNYWQEGVFQWTAETMTALVEGIDALAQIDGISLVDELALRGLELDELQDAMGGSIGGIRFADTDGENDNVNSLDLQMDAIGGALHVAAESLQIEAVNYQSAGMTVRTGAGHLNGLVIDATFPTNDHPDRETTFLLRLPDVEFSDIMVIMADQMWAIASAKVTGFAIRMAELPVPAESMAGDGRGAAVLAALQPQDALLNQIIAAAGVAGATEDIMGQALGGYGGIEIELADLQLDGITGSGGAQVDSVRIQDVQLNIERLPSRAANQQIEQMRGRIEANTARIGELQGQENRSEVDEHELTRLQGEGESLNGSIAELQGQLPEMQAREERFLELYARHRRNEDLGDESEEFMRLRDEFEPQMTASVGSLRIEGAGMGGQGSGSVQVDDVTASGGGEILSQLMTADYTGVATMQEGAYMSRGMAGERALDNVEDGSGPGAAEAGITIRAGRVQAQDISAMGTIPDYCTMNTRRTELLQISVSGRITEEERTELETLNAQWAAVLTNGQTFGQVVAELLELEAGGANALTRGATNTEAAGSAETLTRRHELRELLRADATIVESIDIRGMEMTVAGEADLGSMSGGGTTNLSMGEMQVDGIQHGATTIEQVTGTGLSVRDGGAIAAMAQGDMERGFAGGASAESLTVRNVNNRDTGTQVGLVDLRGASVDVDTTGEGSASIGFDSLRVEDVTQSNRLAMVQQQIAELEGMDNRNPGQSARLESLRREEAELIESGQSAEQVTHVDTMEMEGFSMDAAGFGNPMEEDWDWAGRDMTLSLGLESASLGNLTYTDGTMSFGVNSASLSNFSVDVTVGFDRTEDENGDPSLEVRPGSVLRSLNVGAVNVSGLEFRTPVANEAGTEEMVQINMPSAVLEGFRVREIPLDNFDPMTMTGSVELDRVQVGLQARIGDYFEAGGNLEMNDLSIDALANEGRDVRFHLGEMNLTDLGFRETGTIPDGSMVAAVRGMGGRIDRIGGISADATLSREDGSITFSASLGTFQMPSLNYSGGGHVARVNGGLTMNNASVNGRARLNMDALTSTEQGDDAPSVLESLIVDRFHIGSINAAGIHYENSQYDAVVDLTRGHLTDITVTGYNMNTGAFNLNLGSAGVTGLGVQLTQELEEGGGQRMIQANASASLENLQIGMAGDGSMDFSLDRAGLDSFQAHVQQTGSDASSISIGGAADLRGVEGAANADGTGNVSLDGADMNVEGNYSGDGTTVDFNARGSVGETTVRNTADGVSGSVRDGNLAAGATVTSTNDEGETSTTAVNFDANDMATEFSYNNDGSFSATLDLSSTGVSNTRYSSGQTAVHLSDGRLHGLHVNVSGTASGDVTVHSIRIPQATITGLTVNHEGAQVSLPNATLRGFDVSGLNYSAGQVTGGTVTADALNVDGLNAVVGDSINASANIQASGFRFSVESAGEYAFGLDEVGMSASAGYLGAFNVGGVARATLRGISGTHGAGGTTGAIEEADFTLDDLNADGSLVAEGTGETPEAASGSPMQWSLPFLDHLNGHFAVRIPLGNRLVPVRINIFDGRDPVTAGINSIQVPDRMWGWAPRRVTRMIMEWLLDAIKDQVNDWVPSVRELVEGSLNSTSPPQPDEGHNYSARGLAEQAVESLGGWGVLVDVGSRNGRGIGRVIGDNLIGAGLWVAEQVGVDEAGDIRRAHDQVVQEERIQALEDWISNVGLGLDLTANGGISATQDAAELFSATANASLSGDGSMEDDITADLSVGLTNVRATVGNATVTAESVGLDADATVGVNGQRAGVSGQVQGRARNIEFTAPAGGGDG